MKPFEMLVLRIVRVSIQSCIMRRYVCHDCQRKKFSIPRIQADTTTKPTELVWLLNEVGLVTLKLTELLTEMNNRLETLCTIQLQPHEAGRSPRLLCAVV